MLTESIINGSFFCIYREREREREEEGLVSRASHPCKGKNVHVSLPGLWWYTSGRANPVRTPPNQLSFLFITHLQGLGRNIPQLCSFISYFYCCIGVAHFYLFWEYMANFDLRLTAINFILSCVFAFWTCIYVTASHITATIWTLSHAMEAIRPTESIIITVQVSTVQVSRWVSKVH